MKRIIRLSLLAAIMGATVPVASAQYYSLANQAANMISTALTGGASYRGYADVSYMMGIGNHRANIFEVTTTQGVNLSNMFYMGAGAGLDVLSTSVSDNYNYPGSINNHGTTQTGFAIPLYTDFRLNLGKKEVTSAFIDLRLGASFLVGNKYIQVGDGYLTNSECFYLKPSVGMRVPLSTQNPKLALNISASYLLMTSSSWYVSNNSMTLNSIGLNMGIEW